MPSTDPLTRLAARATDLQQRGERDAATLTDRYAAGLAQGHADAAALILDAIADLRAEAAR